MRKTGIRRHGEEEDYCIVLYLRLFSNMGDKTHPFTISLCNTFMKKVRVGRKEESRLRGISGEGEEEEKGEENEEEWNLKTWGGSGGK